MVVVESMVKRKEQVAMVRTTTIIVLILFQHGNYPQWYVHQYGGLLLMVQLVVVGFVARPVHH